MPILVVMLRLRRGVTGLPRLGFVVGLFFVIVSAWAVGWWGPVWFSLCGAFDWSVYFFGWESDVFGGLFFLLFVPKVVSGPDFAFDICGILVDF